MKKDIPFRQPSSYVNKYEEPEPFVMPECPYELNREALKEWKRIVPLLHEAVDLRKIDLSMVAVYCQEIAKYWACEAILQEKGMTIVTSSGYEQQRPKVSIGKAALTDC